MPIGTPVKVIASRFKGTSGKVVGITGSVAPFHYFVDIGNNKTILVRGDEVIKALYGKEDN